jgi:CheY-like chemotaxis protein
LNQPSLVLIVDDQPDNLYLYSRHFEDHGALRVVTAMRGREAVMMAKRFRPDVVLLDLTLPEMNGYEVARALAGDPATRGIPVVLVSAYATEEDAARVLGGGYASFVGTVAHGYVAKPCEPDVLLGHVRQAISAQGAPTASV